MQEANLIGNTPMIKIYYEYHGIKRCIFTKLEYYNLTGSIKDRIVYHIIKNAIKNNMLLPKMPIVEATSGNTGISLAAIGAYCKNPVYIYMPDWVSEERVKLIKSYGAHVTLISREDGGFVKCVECAKKFAEENNAFLFNQFSNTDNSKIHYETTGKEILKQLNGEIHAFISGVGTGGTLMGVGSCLKENLNDVRIVAIEPEKMPILSEGKIIAQHKIEGIGDDFIPDLIDKKMIDEVILINDDDAINMSKKIAMELGIGVGISSGANMIGAIIENEKNNIFEESNTSVVTVFPDDNKKYMSTDLSVKNSEVDNKNFISNNVKLLDYEVL